MTKLRTRFVAACVAATLGIAPPASASSTEMVAQMDTAAPKSGAPECIEVREVVTGKHVDGTPIIRATPVPTTVYVPNTVSIPPGAAMAVGGIALIMLLGAIHDEALRDKFLVDNLVERCGEMAFVPYFKAKAEKGDADAAVWLGRAYAHAKDWEPAIHWYQAAADRNNAEAQASLGTIYANGNGVPADAAHATALWQQAAGKGSAEAQRSLGRVYIAAQDYARGIEMYRAAGAQRDGESAFRMAEFYEQGIGVVRSDGAAFGWYSMAALSQYPGADAKRVEVAARMKQGDVEDTFKTVQRCFYHQHCDF